MREQHKKGHEVDLLISADQHNFLTVISQMCRQEFDKIPKLWRS